MRTALSTKNSYTHLVFLSGSCYPIKNESAIKDFFKRNQGSQIIKLAKTSSASNHMHSLRAVWLYEVLPTSGGVLTRLVRGFLQTLTKRVIRSLPVQYPVPFYGSQWLALTPECANYVLKYFKENNWYLKYLKYSLAPDEIAIQTIVGNSSFINSTNTVEGGPYGVADLANYHLLHPSLAKWYDISDLENIVSSGVLFVRKVNTNASSELLDRMDSNKKSSIQN